MNVKELAAKLDRCQRGNEISRALEAEAKAAGLVVVFGASDDLMEFRGAIHDEVGAYEGTTALVCAGGVLVEWEDFDERDDEQMVQAYFADKQHAVPVIAKWDDGDYAWTYSTAIPHTTFDVLVDGEPYCRGIVFALADIGAAA